MRFTIRSMARRHRLEPAQRTRELAQVMERLDGANIANARLNDTYDVWKQAANGSCACAEGARDAAARGAGI